MASHEIERFCAFVLYGLNLVPSPLVNSLNGITIGSRGGMSFVENVYLELRLSLQSVHLTSSLLVIWKAASLNLTFASGSRSRGVGVGVASARVCRVSF